MLNIDRRHFIAALGGSAAVASMSAEAKADALENYLIANLGEGGGGAPVAAPSPPPRARRSMRRFQHGVIDVAWAISSPPRKAMSPCWSPCRRSRR